jgi:hypothetical protein
MVKRVRRSTRAAVAALTAIVVVGAGSVTSAAPAHASTWGGADPSGCASPVTFATTPIYGSRGYLAGVQIGELQLRWSWSCYGNWARVLLWGGMYSSPVTVELRIEAEGRAAGSYETNIRTGSAGTSAWSPYFRVASSNSVACGYASLSSDFGTLNFHTNGAHICA